MNEIKKIMNVFQDEAEELSKRTGLNITALDVLTMLTTFYKDECITLDVERDEDYENETVLVWTLAMEESPIVECTTK